MIERTKRWGMTAIGVMLLYCLAACSPAAPVAEPTSTPAPTPAPTLSSSLAPTPTPLPQSGATGDNTLGERESVELTGGFKKLAANSEYVLLGRCTENLGMWNSARDMNDISKEQTENLIYEMQFEFTVDKVYKGEEEFSPGDSLVYTIPYKYKMKDMQDFVQESGYMETPLEVSFLLFLRKDQDFPIYYPWVEPHRFELVDGSLYIRTAHEDIARKWEKGAGLKGIPFAEFEDQMGVASPASSPK